MVIGDNYTEIGKDGFLNCKRLKDVIIPSSVIKLGKQAFYNCESLTELTLPSSIEEIEDSAFSLCEKLTSVNIEDTKIKKIEKYTFANSVKLQHIQIPVGVTEIGAYAFSHCDSLRSIHIPNSVTKIGEYAFKNCRVLHVDPKNIPERFLMLIKRQIQNEPKGGKRRSKNKTKRRHSKKRI